MNTRVRTISSAATAVAVAATIGTVMTGSAPAEASATTQTVRTVDWDGARVEQPGIGTVVLKDGRASRDGVDISLRSVAYGSIFGQGEAALLLIERRDSTGTYAEVHVYKYVTLPDSSKKVLGELQPPVNGQPGLPYSAPTSVARNIAVQGTTVVVTTDGGKTALKATGTVPTLTPVA